MEHPQKPQGEEKRRRRREKKKKKQRGHNKSRPNSRKFEFRV